jgi:hypothetical protein
LRRWWAGLREWIAERGGPVSLAALPLRPGRGTRNAVRHLRRALRDVRDRAARCPGGGRWRSVAFAGLAVDDAAALVMVGHPGIGRGELAVRLARRFDRTALSDLGDAIPTASFSPAVSAELARAGRGTEPLRVVVAPQRARAAAAAAAAAAQRAASTAGEPMPTIVA